MNRLIGKHALVTGGTRGIGEAIVRRMAQEGARIVLTGRDAVRGETVAAALNDVASFRLLEVTDEESWQLIATEFRSDPFDILVNNAGGLQYAKAFDSISPHEWRLEIEVNLTGPFLGMHTLIPMMLRRGRGSIINIASMSGVRAQPDAPAYQAAKAGVRWLTKNAAMTYAARGIRINTINPGSILTSSESLAPTERERWFHDRIPMRRLGSPAEVAEAAVFLASDESSYITGIDLHVDGGYVL